MKIFVSVKPGAKREEVKSADGTHITVWVHARAHDGKANEAVIQMLAGHFGVASSRIKIVTGYASRQKIIEIL